MESRWDATFAFFTPSCKKGCEVRTATCFSKSQYGNRATFLPTSAAGPFATFANFCDVRFYSV